MRESIRHTVPSYPIDCRRVMFCLVSRAQALFVIGSALTVAVFFLALWLLPEQPFLFSNKLLRCSDLTSGFYRRLTFVYGARWNNSHAALHNGRVRFGSGSAFTRVPMLKLDGLARATNHGGANGWSLGNESFPGALRSSTRIASISPEILSRSGLSSV
jgi:hypothetical protein